jgi:hypothetical protein
MPVVQQQQQQQQQQESLKRARTSRRGQGGSQEAPVHPSMPAGKQQRTSQPHTSEGGEGDDKRVPATTSAPQKTNELICLENPQIRGMEFQMDLIPEKELTKSLPGDVVSFQKLACFRNGKRAYHFIDDTLMIQSIMEEHMFKRIYITGPRRFGKSVNLSMFESFLDSHCSGNQPIKEENRRLFEDLKISKAEKFCADHQQQYFVIKLDFSSLNDTTMLETQGPLAGIMFEVYNRFLGICQGSSLSKYLNLLGDFMLGGVDQKGILENSLSRLADYIKRSAIGSRMKIALLVDEFDKPYISAMNKGRNFYDSLQQFMDSSLESKKDCLILFSLPAYKSFPFKKEDHIVSIVLAQFQSLTNLSTNGTALPIKKWMHF